jgi:hypothetical protein
MFFLQIKAEQFSKLTPVYSQNWIELQASIYQLIQIAIFSFYFDSSLFFEFEGIAVEGMNFVKNFMQDDTNGPDIAL